jgi:hypothetical protein
MNKPLLISCLGRCEAIVLQEKSNLSAWANDPRMTAGRKADCMRSIRFVTIGFSAPLNITRTVRDAGDALAEAEVKRPPSTHSAEAVAQLRAEMEARGALDGPVLPDGIFEMTLSRAEDNASHAADCAAAILDECRS